MDTISGDNCFRILDETDHIFFYFTASWCGPCQKISPEILKIKEKLEDYPIQFYKIDIDDPENDEICERCNITSVPSFLLFKNRTLLSKVLGADLESIINMLADNCEFIKNN